MAPKSKAPAYAEIAAKEPNFRHRAFADWLAANTGHDDIDVKTVQLVLSLTKPFRASPDYAAVKKQISEERANERAAARERRIERQKEQAKKLRERLAALEAEIPAPAPAKAAARKAAAPRPARNKAPAKPRDEVGAKRAARKRIPASKPKPGTPVATEMLDDGDVF